jgi:uncharacterized protein YbjT (DUF2867 family)
MSTVLLVGGTGQVGSRIAKRFLEKGFSVKLLVRNLEDSLLKAEPLVHSGATIVRADLLNPESMQGITQGVDYIVATAATLDDSFTAGYNALIEDAAGHVQHVVYITNIPRIEPLLPMFQAKQAVENIFQDSGINYTILPCEILARYMVDSTMLSAQTYGMPVSIFCSDETLAGNAKHCFVDEEFVADVAVAVTGNPKAFNKTIQVAGPRAMTFRELLEMYNDVNKAQLEALIIQEPVAPYVTQEIFAILDQTHKYETQETGAVISEEFGVPQIPIEQTVLRNTQ